MTPVPPDILKELPEDLRPVGLSIDLADVGAWLRHENDISAAVKAHYASEPRSLAGNAIWKLQYWTYQGRVRYMAAHPECVHLFETTHAFDASGEADDSNKRKMSIADSLHTGVRFVTSTNDFKFDQDWLSSYILNHKRSYLFYSYMFDETYDYAQREEWLVRTLITAAAEYDGDIDEFRGANIAFGHLTREAKEEPLQQIIGLWMAQMLSSKFYEQERLVKDMLGEAPDEVRYANNPAIELLELYVPKAVPVWNMAQELNLDLSTMLSGVRKGPALSTSMTMPNVDLSFQLP